MTKEKITVIEQCTEEARCAKCGKLLFKANPNPQHDSQIEIEAKCPRCGEVNKKEF